MMKRLLTKIEKFLSTKNHSNGTGWPDISIDETNELYDVVRDMIKCKWGTDSDGDIPIKPSFEVRKEGTMPSVFPVPHFHKCNTPQSRTEFIEALAENVANTARDLAHGIEMNRKFPTKPEDDK